VKFRSGFEERVYKEAKRKRKKLEYEPNSPRVMYTILFRYIPDFILPNGIIVEAKGWLRPADRTKMRKVKEDNPNLDIRFVFQNANSKITKAKKSERYWEWAERLGFKWAEGNIPVEWWSE
jgi:hypothetical protein